ncbi:hypothetical protein L873DRAFT_1871331 [Choiromyces venosus 120613-1]|uniref:Uncharacterized protein n=1 Tax=Choiromyces venosus 120613-1 TaxID=1336337 RepID=A0A3N4JXQ7_9PEZI|nr:hypothetical protein L873DRAFT_1871331 [Choiromyces venosus 120613-1]
MSEKYYWVNTSLILLENNYQILIPFHHLGLKSFYLREEHIVSILLDLFLLMSIFVYSLFDFFLILSQF